jgi:hypothetical protein
MRKIFFLSGCLLILLWGCKKDQPIPANLQGYWQLSKTINVAYRTISTNLSGTCLHFSDKSFSNACKTGQKETGHRYIFTPDAHDPTRGTIEFKGKKMDPDTYTLSFSGDTLVLTPPSEVYDIKYYIPER